MEIKTKLTTVNRTVMSNKQNKYIVIHYVGAVSTAKANADYFYSVNRQASAHYFVDENEIWQVVKEGDGAWHCGTTGKYYHSECRNTNSIGIEMCCYMNNGVLDIKEETINKTIELVKELMAKYNIPVGNVIRHYDVTHKVCPAPFVNNSNRWNDFKSRLVGPSLQYQVHLQDLGWQSVQNAGEGAGTEGQAKRLEAVKFFANNGLQIKYRAHVQYIGWQDWKNSGEIAGTTGQGKGIEAIEIQSNAILEVQEHVQDIGWMPKFKSNNFVIGTVGKALRLEAFRISVV